MRCPAQTAIVLGSGLGDFARTPTDAVGIAYGDVPHWPAAAVIGHAGELVIGCLAGRQVAVLAGRAHLYEGHALQRCRVRDARDGAAGRATVWS